MDLETRLDLIKSVGEEIITEQELKEVLSTKLHPVAYDGFEPSGQMHIAQGLLRTINVNKNHVTETPTQSGQTEKGKKRLTALTPVVVTATKIKAIIMSILLKKENYYTQ